MKNHALPILFFLLLVLAAVIMVACGSSASRSLQSITISPATADAQSYSGGVVQFTATGDYSSAPLEVTPLTATWGACFEGAATSGVSVSANGVAQCAAGSTGTYTVWGYVVSNPNEGACSNVVTACGAGGCRITGTAQLTCP